MKTEEEIRREISRIRHQYPNKILKGNQRALDLKNLSIQTLEWVLNKDGDEAR